MNRLILAALALLLANGCAVQDYLNPTAGALKAVDKFRSATTPPAPPTDEQRMDDESQSPSARVRAAVDFYGPTAGAGRVINAEFCDWLDTTLDEDDVEQVLVKYCEKPTPPVIEPKQCPVIDCPTVECPPDRSQALKRCRDAADSYQRKSERLAKQITDIDDCMREHADSQKMPGKTFRTVAGARRFAECYQKAVDGYGG